MLVGDDLPKLGTDLVTALSWWVKGEGGREGGREMRVQGSCKLVCAMMPELTVQGEEGNEHEKLLLANCAVKR